MLTQYELRKPFEGKLGDEFPVILSPTELAKLLGLKSRKTVDGWIAAGRLNGCFRKRGKHNLIWRDKVLDRLFNGPEWSNEQEN